MSNNYEKCFEKHSFEELNNIDYEIHQHAMKYILNKFRMNKQTIETLHIFDVGCNSGSFVKGLNTFGITKNIHCFEPHPVLSKKTKEVYPYIKMNEICLSNNDKNITYNINKKFKY